jgi:hypothetical protein
MTVIFDPFFAAAPKPSLAHATSPFRARGVVYRADLERMAVSVRGGVDAVLATADDPALAAYFSQKFSPSGWYDIFALSTLARVCARMRGITFTQYVNEAAHHYADVALQGFSGIVLRALSHESIALWIPRVSAWFNDFGEMRTQVAAPGLVRGVRTGLPRYGVLGWAQTAMEFTEAVLERAGAGDVRVHPLAPEPDGERAGIDLYRVPFEIRWRA